MTDAPADALLALLPPCSRPSCCSPGATAQGSRSAVARSTSALARLCARLKFSNANTLAYSSGSHSLASQGLLRKDLRPLAGGGDRQEGAVAVCVCLCVVVGRCKELPTARAPVALMALMPLAGERVAANVRGGCEQRPS